MLQAPQTLLSILLEVHNHLRHAYETCAKVCTLLSSWGSYCGSRSDQSVVDAPDVLFREIERALKMHVAK